MGRNCHLSSMTVFLIINFEYAVSRAQVVQYTVEAESIQSEMLCRANGYGDATDYMSVIHNCIPGK